MENINYTKDVRESFQEHLDESFEYFTEDHIFALCLQGSQNYGLEVANSDVDTKLLVLPTFREVVENRKAVSTTHVRENNEHIDFKDCRLMFQLFLKQNVNILEVLFSKYVAVNPAYREEWEVLYENREAIAHYNKARAVTTMRGMATEKYHALEHRYPTKVEVLDKYGYDPKQLHHLLRLKDFMERYIEGESYEACLKPLEAEYLKKVKCGLYGLEEARELAKKTLDEINELSKPYKKGGVHDVSDKKVEALLSEVLYSLMEKSVKKDLAEKVK